MLLIIVIDRINLIDDSIAADGRARKFGQTPAL
jgi:hypothetical protein